MLQFIKNWTLPLAMLVGVIGYFCFAAFDFRHIQHIIDDTQKMMACSSDFTGVYSDQSFSYFCSAIVDILQGRSQGTCTSALDNLAIAYPVRILRDNCIFADFSTFG